MTSHRSYKFQLEIWEKGALRPCNPPRADAVSNGRRRIRWHEYSWTRPTKWLVILRESFSPFAFFSLREEESASLSLFSSLSTFHSPDSTTRVPSVVAVASIRLPLSSPRSSITDRTDTRRTTLSTPAFYLLSAVTPADRSMYPADFSSPMFARPSQYLMRETRIHGIHFKSCLHCILCSEGSGLLT